MRPAACDALVLSSTYGSNSLSCLTGNFKTGIREQKIPYQGSKSFEQRKEQLDANRRLPCQHGFDGEPSPNGDEDPRRVAIALAGARRPPSSSRLIPPRPAYTQQPRPGVGVWCEHLDPLYSAITIGTHSTRSERPLKRFTGVYSVIGSLFRPSHSYAKG